jgi:Fe-Mn family superoxide dismutase
MERREFVVAAAGASLAVLGGPDVFASDTKDKSGGSVANGKIYNIVHSLTPLPFKPEKLIGISEKLIISHWENNYGASVKTLNATRKKLAEAVGNSDTPPFVLAWLKREQLMRTGSVILHGMYFGNLGGNGKCGNNLQKRLANDFGTYDAWESEFRKIGQSLGGGSGWVILGYNYQFKTIENYWSPDHLHSPPATVPLLVMDMYEHSYQMDYGAAAAKYIDAFFKNINWEQVESRLENALKIKSGII